ncbi:hypothetical protein MKK69_05320 [Methylobacterium sp. J-026]|uniref:hypothetical protein n=1 Tax=Methylobacterium sp. J-026 TaxID=2836624 RepID=UPI001FBA9031|nr:hypothetical protein [Methylobacterium sp. J-026]MCJ2133490.1 hypothetical protein [Methylobacterium sp. J-026]
MASGYVIAAVLEAAGLIGLAIALVTMRAERRAKAAELRSFLRSGQSASSAFDTAGSYRQTDSGTRVIAIPYTSKRRDGVPAPETAARSALGRAIQQFRTDIPVPVSAG